MTKTIMYGLVININDFMVATTRVESQVGNVNAAILRLEHFVFTNTITIRAEC